MIDRLKAYDTIENAGDAGGRLVTADSASNVHINFPQTQDTLTVPWCRRPSRVAARIRWGRPPGNPSWREASLAEITEKPMCTTCARKAKRVRMFT